MENAIQISLTNLSNITGLFFLIQFVSYFNLHPVEDLKIKFIFDADNKTEEM